jgi:hypothetical protein
MPVIAEIQEAIQWLKLYNMNEVIQTQHDQPLHHLFVSLVPGEKESQRSLT